MEHTPGPWHIEKRHDGVPFGISSPATMKHDCDVLCKMPSQSEMDAKTIIANANLIAAAPDLLAACQAVLYWVDSAELFLQLYAAIDKAEGKPTNT